MRLLTAVGLAAILVASGACQASAPASSAAVPASPRSSPAVSPSASTETVGAPSVAPSASASATDAWQLLALGDSETTGSGDPAHKGWAVYYADAIQTATSHPVKLTNLARNGTTSAVLLQEVLTDKTRRDAIAAADIVTLGIGGAD